MSKFRYSNTLSDWTRSTIEDTATTFEELEREFGLSVANIVKECSDDKSLAKDERKRQQIEHAAHASQKAKLVKLADKLYNLSDLLQAPPPSWYRFCFWFLEKLTDDHHSGMRKGFKGTSCGRMLWCSAAKGQMKSLKSSWSECLPQSSRWRVPSIPPWYLKASAQTSLKSIMQAWQLWTIDPFLSSVSFEGLNIHLRASFSFIWLVYCYPLHGLPFVSMWTSMHRTFSYRVIQVISVGKLTLITKLFIPQRGPESYWCLLHMYRQPDVYSKPPTDLGDLIDIHRRFSNRRWHRGLLSWTQPGQGWWLAWWMVTATTSPLQPSAWLR